jgi:hypothetical protein
LTPASDSVLLLWLLWLVQIPKPAQYSSQGHKSQLDKLSVACPCLNADRLSDLDQQARGPAACQIGSGAKPS